MLPRSWFLPILASALAVLAACGEARARLEALADRSEAPARVTSAAPLPGDTASLFDAYSANSPHWPHIRTIITDFRTHYLKPAQRAQEIAWGARHYDWVMSGDATAYRAVNPTVTILPYALDWDPPVPTPKMAQNIETNFVPDMQRWFARHPQYSLERAFLHRAGVPPSPASRVQFHLWTNERWVINPGDPGARAYQVDRIQRVVANADGVFFDEHASADVVDRIHKIPIAEYPDLKGYDTALLGMLRAIRAAIEPKHILINTSEYKRPLDREMILTAGGTLLERMNNPLTEAMEARWKFIDDLLAHGATVELASLNSSPEQNSGVGAFRPVTPGDYGSRAERMKLWELASYYMVVPAKPDRLLLDLEPGGKVPWSSVWLRAQEADIGHPHAPRAIVQRGKDPTGAGYRIWGRDFDRALVLVRPVGGWRDQRYGDSTAVSVQLPRTAEWRLLRGGGTLGPPITAVQLRNMEAAILIKGPRQPSARRAGARLSAASRPAPPVAPADGPSRALSRRCAAAARGAGRAPGEG